MSIVDQDPEDLHAEDTAVAHDEDSPILESSAPNETGLDAPSDTPDDDASGSDAVADDAEADEDGTESGEAEDAQKSQGAHISSAGSEYYLEDGAHEDVGKIHGEGTTGAHIKVITPRQPGLEAALRGAATDMKRARGEVSGEDAPQEPEFKPGLPSENPAINPNSPTQVGDTRETAEAAAQTKIDSGDAVGPVAFPKEGSGEDSEEDEPESAEDTQEEPSETPPDDPAEAH